MGVARSARWPPCSAVPPLGQLQTPAPGRGVPSGWSPPMLASRAVGRLLTLDRGGTAVVHIAPTQATCCPSGRAAASAWRVPPPQAGRSARCVREQRLLGKAPHALH